MERRDRICDECLSPLTGRTLRLERLTVSSKETGECVTVFDIEFCGVGCYDRHNHRIGQAVLDVKSLDDPTSHERR